MSEQKNKLQSREWYQKHSSTIPRMKENPEPELSRMDMSAIPKPELPTREWLQQNSSTNPIMEMSNIPKPVLPSREWYRNNSIH